MKNILSILAVSLVLILLYSCGERKYHLAARPIATWDFRAGDVSCFTSDGMEHLTLKPGKGEYPSFKDNKLNEWKSLEFDGKSDWLYIENGNVGGLDIRTGEVTVVALVKWEGQHNSFVAGMWNECDCKRQYGLFVSLPCYNGKDKVCGHISLKGGPTPPFPYSIDYSASKSSLLKGLWQIIAMTYDGEYIKSYINGKFKEVEPELINNTAGFEGCPDGLVQRKNPYYYPDGMGNNGSDFTVGAVKLPGGEMGNFFKGEIRRISVFNRCLDPDEIIEFTFDEVLD